MVVTLRIRRAEKADVEQLADIAFRAWEHGILPLLRATPELVRREKQRLHNIVAETTDVIEKMCIETALELTRNNRVAAADMLSLSRQSVYVKLRKYGLINKDGE